MCLLPAKHVCPSILVWNDVSLAAGSVAGARPEEGVFPVSIIHEVVEHQGLVIHGVDISAHLDFPFLNLVLCDQLILHLVMI